RMREVSCVRLSAAIRKPVEMSDWTNHRGRKRRETVADKHHNLLLFFSRDQKSDMTAAAERRVGQGDARLAFCADDRDHPPPRLLQRRLAWEQRSRVSVLSNAETRDIEQRAAG